MCVESSRPLAHKGVHLQLSLDPQQIATGLSVTVHYDPDKDTLHLTCFTQLANGTPRCRFSARRQHPGPIEDVAEVMKELVHGWLYNPLSLDMAAAHAMLRWFPPT